MGPQGPESLTGRAVVEKLSVQLSVILWVVVAHMSRLLRCRLFRLAWGPSSGTIVGMSNSTAPGRLLTLHDAADFLAVSVKTVRRLVETRQLDHVRVGGRRQIRFTPEQLDTYVRRHTVEAVR